MNNSFLESIARRRSIYHLGPTLPVSQQEVTTTIEQAVSLAPSAFNSQSSRVVILYGEESKKLWNIVFTTLEKLITEAQIEATKQHIDSFAQGAGTVLVFEDRAVIEHLQGEYPRYKDAFPQWSEHGSAITQFSIWSALATINVGASLQHYGNLIEDAVLQNWNLPSTWSLIAQMPFGSVESPAGEKTMLPINERVTVFSS